MPFPFTKKHRVDGKALVEEGRVKSVLFSGGTYQIEVDDLLQKKTFWPFLQMRDDGKLTDRFCTCAQAGECRSCPHLAAAYLFINPTTPLHVRFQASLWNKLCLMAFIRHEDAHENLKQGSDGEYVIKAPKGEVLFSINPKTRVGQEWIHDMIFHRKEETEETSLKFSNLSTEELKLWKKGTPSPSLQYELSFWSDLAKWMMLGQVFEASYTITFPALKEALPKKVKVTFPDLEMEFYIAEVNWKELIPVLKDVQTPLPVHQFREVQIEKILYHPEKKEMEILSHPLALDSQEKEIEIGEWIFIPTKGFFPKKESPILKQKVIRQQQIEPLLRQNYEVVATYLRGTPIAREKISPSYHLSFDSSHALHIKTFVFEVGDLQRASTTFFGSWVYLEDCGFFLLDDFLFEEIETVISSDQIEEFIKEYRLWLNQQEEFQIHLSSVEFLLTYQFDGNALTFKSESQPVGGGDGLFDFGGWLYVQGKGFYKKLRTPVQTDVAPGKVVTRHAIPHFIHTNREGLEQIKNFFSHKCPIKKVGVHVMLNPKKQIEITPEYTYEAAYQGRQVDQIGDFTYVEGEGFFEIPHAQRLPEKYCYPVLIGKGEESHFVQVELPKLNTFILKIDRRLKKALHLNLRLKHIDHDLKSPLKDWNLRLSYESEWGEVSLLEMKQALDDHLSYAMTDAGLISLKDPRFNWLRTLDKGRLHKEGEEIHLSTLEWMRLRIFEEIKMPYDKEPAAAKMGHLLEPFDRFETDSLFSLEGLQSTLRPYQEVGVKWLWFLYVYGLSGLLCDDMGLGKTHQAMALLAAVKNSGTEKKKCYFVVCPTSVIYHWEELLKNFLPDFRVIVFYGTQRSLTPLKGKADIVLTSYGVMRSEKKNLKKIAFELAIFDELQVAKNIQSQTHIALTAIRARTKVGLTGTPIENRILELKALFEVILPGYLPPIAEYRQLFVNPIEKYQDKEKEQLLRRLIHPFVMRRKKTEVLDDLPEKIEEIAHCSLSDEQAKLYTSAFLASRDDLMATIEDGEKNVPYLHVFALLSKLKQICNHPCLVNKDLENYTKYKSGKWDYFVELVKETRESGLKLVVFTQYLDMMKIIEYYLSEHQIGYAAIKGATRDRKKQLQNFRDNPECEVFIGSLQAAGTGIDLTAASVVIHYDRWWNPAKENQATDRVHRIGQNRGVQVFKMVTKGTIEEYIHILIEKKLGLLEGVIGYDDQHQIKSLDRKDLIQLLQQINRSCQT